MKQIGFLVGTVLVVVLLWPYPVFYPLKLLVVFFHESSHALITVATGGTVLELVVNEMQGGHVLSQGGNRFLTLTAGYLGSLVWGVVIYLLAVGSRFDKAVMVGLGGVIILICAFFVRDLFALVFALLTATAMIIVGARASHEVNDVILRVIGLTNMMYVPLDIWSDTIERSGLRSDAFMLAEEYGGSGMLWGGVWLLISLVIVGYTLYLGTRIGPRSGTRSSARSSYNGSVNYDD